MFVCMRPSLVPYLASLLFVVDDASLQNRYITWWIDLIDGHVPRTLYSRWSLLTLYVEKIDHAAHCQSNKCRPLINIR